MSQTFRARWVPPSNWQVKAPWSGWINARGSWTEQEAAAAVRRTFGSAVPRGFEVAVEAPAAEGDS